MARNADHNDIVAMEVTVSLRAIAYHESISVDALEKIYRSDWNQLFGANTFAHCKKCGALFAVFLPKSDDLDNGSYVGELEKRITEDCQSGKHQLIEVRFESQ